MHPREHAAHNPEKPAIVMAASGKIVSYGELVSRSNKLASYLRSMGLATGDGVALLLENHPRYYEPVWATQNTGLYLTTLSTHLTPPEVAHILTDSEARVLITSRAFADKIAALRSPGAAVETHPDDGRRGGGNGLL